MISEDCKKLQKNLILNFIVVGIKICFYCSLYMYNKYLFEVYWFVIVHKVINNFF